MSKSHREVEANSADQAIPSRVLGLTIMWLLIAFVAVWMTVQSQLQNSMMGTPAGSSGQGPLAGFLDRAWYLPDEPLLGFVRIPSGPFTMGSNPALDRLAYENERWSSSRRQGSVEVDDFYIGMFEVTVAQFRVFVAENPSLADAIPQEIAGDMPVTNITWPEALAYARWLQGKLLSSEDTPAELQDYLAAGGQLSIPSEAEWEKAARGSDGRIFPWGNQASTQYANYSAGAALPVGSKACVDCSFGLQDMSGNVWELTRSPLQDYPYDPGNDGENLSDDALFVMRGGSFADAVANVRAAVRGGVDPSVRNNTIGFRLVISKP